MDHIPLSQNKARLESIATTMLNNQKLLKALAPLRFEDLNKQIKTVNRKLGPDSDQQKIFSEIDELDKTVRSLIDEKLAERIKLDEQEASWLTIKKEADDKIAAAKNVVAAAATNKLLEAMNLYNEKYAYVKFASRVLVMQEAPDEFGNSEAKFYYPRDIAAFHQNHNITNSEGKKLNVFNEWTEWENRKSYSGLMFDPAVNEREIHKFDGIYLNRWQGYSVEPEEGDDDDLYWELVKTGLCNGNEVYYEYVRKWLAHMIQKPTERPLTAIGIVSQQGSGKSAFAEVVGGLLGRHFNPNITMRDLTGQFTGGLKDVILGLVDEASWGGDKTNAGQLKAVITRSEERLELKGKDAINVPSYKRLIFASNNAYYYHADADDRRLLPLEPDDKVINKANKVFWDKFWKKVKNGKMKANLLRHLLDEDISKFNPYENLRDMQIITGWSTMYESLAPHEKWMYHAINDKVFSNCTNEWDDKTECRDVGKIQRAQLNASYETFKKTNTYWAGGISARDRKMDHYLSEVMGASYGGNLTKNNMGRVFNIDWNLMKTNFEAKYRYAVEWAMNDDNVVPIENAKAKHTSDQFFSDVPRMKV